MNLRYRTTLRRFKLFALGWATLLPASIGNILIMAQIDRALHPIAFWAQLIPAAMLFILVLITVYWMPSRTVLFLSASGVKDLRLAPEEIPWTAIRAIREEEEELFGLRTIPLEIDPSCLAALSLTKIAKMLRRKRRAFAPNDLCVISYDLNIRYEDLLATFKRGWEEARAIPAVPTNGSAQTP